MITDHSSGSYSGRSSKGSGDNNPEWKQDRYRPGRQHYHQTPQQHQQGYWKHSDTGGQSYSSSATRQWKPRRQPPANREDIYLYPGEENTEGGTHSKPQSDASQGSRWSHGSRSTTNEWISPSWRRPHE